MAMAAAPLQQNVTDQGDIIVKLNRVLTMRAARSGPDNRFLFRQPEDTNVQETADQRPEYNRNNVPHSSFLNAWRIAHSVLYHLKDA